MNARVYKIVSVIAILALAALACGLSVPDGTPVPGAADSGGGSGGKKILTDNFEGRNTNWGIGTDADSSVEYVDGALQFIVFTANYFVYSGPNDEIYENVHIEVDAQNTSTDPNIAFGIICDQQFLDDSHYYAYITPLGDYGIVLAALAQDDVDLAADSSDSIPQNADSYHIGLDCGNGKIALYVNGQQVASVDDATYTSGKIALFVWSDEIAAGALVTYDNFVMTELP